MSLNVAATRALRGAPGIYCGIGMCTPIRPFLLQGTTLALETMLFSLRLHLPASSIPQPPSPCDPPRWPRMFFFGVINFPCLDYVAVARLAALVRGQTAA